MRRVRFSGHAHGDIGANKGYANLQDSSHGVRFESGVQERRVRRTLS